MKARASPGFTLLELLVVIGLIAVMSFFLGRGLTDAGTTAALQSGQSLIANLVTAARTKAMARGQSARVLVHVDPGSTGQPRRYLRQVAVQVQTGTGWQTVTDACLPEGIYIVPGNFSTIPAGLFATGPTISWIKVDGSALRSTALRSNQITAETINSPDTEQWVSFTLSAQAGTAQPGDIILASGRARAPGSYLAGESPVELVNPENVRGLTLSSYGVPAFINSRSGF